MDLTTFTEEGRVNRAILEMDFDLEKSRMSEASFVPKSEQTSEFDFTPDELVELSLLRSLEIDEMVEASLIPPSSRFDETLLDRITLAFPEIIISLSTGPAYPAQQLKIEYENVLLPRLVMDTLRIESRKIVEKGEAKNNTEKWGERDVTEVFDFHTTAFEIATFCEKNIGIYRQRLRAGISTIDMAKNRSASEISSALPQIQNGVKNNSVGLKGLDLSTISADATASSILKALPEEICSLIPLSFRVLHIESVLRSDLHKKFLLRQSLIFENLKTQSVSALSKCIPPHARLGCRDAETMARYLSTPRMTFHGTSNQYVPSIIRHGFLAPGSKHPETHELLPVRCGSTYGQGIYSSPSPYFSLSYSGTEAQPTKPDGFWGLKLFVCATVMGRSCHMTRNDEWWDRHEPFAGADSHVANNQMEYIVFDNAQILPCYVIHLDWGAENAQFFKDIDPDRKNFKAGGVGNGMGHQRLMGMVLTPGDRQRQKEALVAKASKYFPYGYGPASGTRFVVEEVGEVDEDEEEYGDYQDLRVEEVEGNTYGFWEWEDEEVERVEASKFDEYTALRSGYGPAGMGK